MTVKIFGVAMILLSCFAISRMLISYESKKIRQIDSFIALIRYIRNQIDCYSIPMDKILSDCSSDIFDNIGGKPEELGFQKILDREEIIVDGEGRRILVEFGESLGKNYRDRQVKLCDSAVSSLEAVRHNEVKNYNGKKKTINVLCFAIGGIIILLFI